MLSELRMNLEVDRPDFGYYQSSNMQGILMEQINAAYAKQLHRQGLKPYSQYIQTGEQTEWVVKTLTREAYQEIILPLLDKDFSQCTVQKKETHIKIKEKTLKILKKQELLDEFYSDACHRYLNLEFLTPASFKSNGRYVILPDIRLFYQSLMNKYSAASPNMEMYDTQTLEQLADNSVLVHYRLRSALFPIEGIKIPSFKGEMSVKITGTATMAKYARLLARFGEYSGAGIKTAMGMGGFRIKEWREEK